MSSEKIEIKANAKINLTLDILGTRDDGYHEVAMVMQEVSLHDNLYMEKTDGGIELEIPGSDLPADNTNLCYRAAALVMEECGLNAGVKITLDKHIPIAAGLAGGSSDAAAVQNRKADRHDPGVLSGRRGILPAVRSDRENGIRAQ